MPANKLSRYLLALSLMPLQLMLSSCGHEVMVRLSKIRVVDAETKRPLPNILVYYVVQSYIYKDKILLFLPSPEQRLLRQTTTKKIYNTDDNGEVNFGALKLLLDSNENIYSENIYVNLDIRLDKIILKEHQNLDKIENFQFYMGFYATDKDKFFNVNPNYQGYHIYSTTRDLDPKLYGGSKRDKFDILWNGKGLLKEREEFVIELKRKEVP